MYDFLLLLEKDILSFMSILIMEKAIVLGGGFIGNHLIKKLKYKTLC